MRSVRPSMTAGRRPDGSVRLLSMHLALNPSFDVRVEQARVTAPPDAQVPSGGP